MEKNFTLFDRSFRVEGSAADTYFASLPDGEDITDSVLRGIQPYVGHSGVVIDVGANIGLYSLALSRIAEDGLIYAFEPSPGSFRFLLENLERNEISNVHPFQLALGKEPGTLHFHDVPFFTAGSFVVDEGSFLTGEVIGSDFIEVPCTTLDDFVFDRGIDRLDLLKIDVEGAEMSVLAGALGTLERFRPKVLLEFSSFAFTLHQNLLPQKALAGLQETFPYVYVVGRSDGTLRRISNASNSYDFLYDNGIHGPVDNLLCTFDDLGGVGDYCRLADQVAAQEEEGPAEPAPQNDLRPDAHQQAAGPATLLRAGIQRAARLARRAASAAKLRP